MKILITNDDGINAEGLSVLVDCVRNYGEIIVVAPMVEQSGKSHSINVYSGIKGKKHPNLFGDIEAYSLDSTPADCVRFAHHYLKYDFDVVLSGVNNGYNMGEDIMYSGTVAGAAEAHFLGKKGLAFSTTKNDFSGVAANFDKIMTFIIDNKLLEVNDVYNINIPPVAKGIRLTKQGSTHYDVRFDIENDLYFQRGGPHFEREKFNLASDVNAIINQRVSITPLTNDRTNYHVFKKLTIHK